MSFVPNTPAERTKMLQTAGVRAMDDLFHDVPANVRYPRLDLPAPVSEPEIMAEMESLTSHNADAASYASFLGAGAYRHFIPSVVSHVISRGEFYTAYTPYQAEISQGTLQSIFEYQSMICALTGMDVANASHYDGATAVAEAAIMAHNATRGRKKIIVSPALLDKGIHKTVCALIEEHIHIKSEECDETRDFQNAIFEEFVDYMKNVNAFTI